MSDRYVIVIERADHNFSAYAPDVLGCITTGPTFEATVESMREALAFHLDSMRAAGEELPEATTKLGDPIELYAEAVGVLQVTVPQAALA